MGELEESKKVRGVLERRAKAPGRKQGIELASERKRSVCDWVTPSVIGKSGRPVLELTGYLVHDFVFWRSSDSCVSSAAAGRLRTSIISNFPSHVGGLQRRVNSSDEQSQAASKVIN